MSYDIYFRGGGSVHVNNERGEKVKDMWFTGESKLTPIDIDGDGYLIGDIKRIQHVPDSPIRDPFPTQRQLAGGKVCHGQFSIQKTINEMAQSEGNQTTELNPDAKPWTKLIADKPWREKVRQLLRAQAGVVWCDYKAGECACDDNN